MPLRIPHLHEPIPEVNTISKICAGNMTIERSRIKLGEHKNLVYTTVDAVAHWNVYEPVASSNWDLHIKTHKSHGKTSKCFVLTNSHAPIALLIVWLITWKISRGSSKFLNQISKIPNKKYYLTAGVAALVVRGNR